MSELGKRSKVKMSKYSDFAELSAAGIDTWINSDSSLNVEVTAPDSILPRKQPTDEDDTKKRKRGRRGGRKRGFDQKRTSHSGGLMPGKQTSPNLGGNSLKRKSLKKKEPKQGARNVASLSNLPDGILLVEHGKYKGYHCAFCNCSLNSVTTMRSHTTGSRHQANMWKRKLVQREKSGLNASNSESENSTNEVAPLSKLPDGILFVADGSYVGYHCTYCNCALKYTSSIDTHLEGFRHKLMIETRSRLEEQKKAEVDGKKCEKSVLKNEEKDEKEVGVLLEDSTSKASVPKEKDEKDVKLLLEDSTPKASASLASSLEDALTAVSEPVIGLDYITQYQTQDEPSYECSLCSVLCEIDDIKAHILGTRHRLMYMKKTDPKKIAELMAKNLSKGERNKEIREYIASAMEKYGKGTVVVEISEPSLPKAPQRKDDLKTSDEPRKSFEAAGSAQQKRVNEEKNALQRKRHCDEFSHRRDISKEASTGKDKRSYGDSYSSDYNRPSSGSDKGRLFEPSLPSHQNKEGPASDPPKLPDIEVTNEEEAGIVMNAINSLTERFLQYKLKNVSNRTKETLEKSLKGENLLHALTLLSDQSNARATDKPPILPKRGKAPQPQHAYKKRIDAAAVYLTAAAKSMTERYQDRTLKTEIPSLLSLQFDRNENKDTMYSKERKNAYSEFAKCKDVMDHSQYEWNKVREQKSTDSAIPSSHGWDNTKDGRSRELMAQIPSWDERDIRSDKGMTDYQLKQRWGDVRGDVPAYTEGTMSDSDWNRAGNTTGIRDTRSSAPESKRYSYPLSQFPLSWNEPRLSSAIQNKDSLSKTSYSFNKSEGIPSLRSTASFNQQRNWGVDGQSQAQQVWNRTDQHIARSGIGRPIGQSVMDRDDNIYGRGSTGSLPSQSLQSNMGSLAPRRNVSHHTNNDLLDPYQKQLQSENSRNSLTTISPGYQSYATPTLTTRSHYLGPSTPSSFNRPSTFGQLESTSSFLRWK